MNIDTFLKIGHSHTICQDYIISGDVPFPYIILADGCSQSKDSDIGARVLCHTALNFLKRGWEKPDELKVKEMGEEIIYDAEFALQIHFNVSIDSLDATLIIAFKYNDKYYIYMYGDGVVYYVTRINDAEWCRISFTPNTPFYLRYQINGMKQYESNEITMNVDSSRSCFKEIVTKKTEPYYGTISADIIKYLIIASDGVESFMFKEESMYKTLYLDLLRMKKTYDNPPDIKEFNFLDVCSDFTDFKLTKGAFLSRRVKKVMKEYLKKGFVNDDDLSIGCFYED